MFDVAGFYYRCIETKKHQDCLVQQFGCKNSPFALLVRTTSIAMIVDKSHVDSKTFRFFWQHI